MNIIEATILNGITYYETKVRGVEFCAHQNGVGSWVVSSRRTRSTGTVKHFASVQDMAAKVKAFANLDALLTCEAVG